MKISSACCVCVQVAVGAETLPELLTAHLTSFSGLSVCPDQVT